MRTNAEGWFAVILQDSEWTVSVSYEKLTQIEPTAGVRPGDPPVEIHLGPPPRRSILGKVLFDGKPIESAHVKCWRLPEGRYIQGYSGVTTDAVGAFELPGVDADRVILVAQSPDFAFARSGEVQVPSEGTAEGVVVLPVPGADLELKVKDKEGRPVADARVDLLDGTSRRV